MDRLVKKQRRYLKDIMPTPRLFSNARLVRQPKHSLATQTFTTPVYYRLQCVCESVRNLLFIDPTVSERYFDIPWAGVRNIGNVIRHEYGDIDTSAILEIIVGDRLRDLLAVARQELSPLEA